MPGCGSLVILDRSPVLGRGGSSCGSLVLGVLLLALPLYHDPVPDVQVVGPIHRVHLLVFTAVTGILPAIGHSLVNDLVVWQGTLQATAIYHHATATSRTSTVS
jgi:hypothetical protein